LIRRIDGEWAEVILPYEFLADFPVGFRLPVLDQEGGFLEDAELLKKTFNKKHKTWILNLKVSRKNAPKAIGIRIQPKEATAPLPSPRFEYIPDNAIVCRCERVTVGEIVQFIKDNDIQDINQLKTLRVGMGACGSKTCSVLLPQVFRKAKKEPSSVTLGTLRPLALEIPMQDIINEASKGRAV